MARRSIAQTLPSGNNFHWDAVGGGMGIGKEKDKTEERERRRMEEQSFVGKEISGKCTQS